MFRDENLRIPLLYRRDRKRDPDSIEDLIDGSYIEDLKNTNVSWNNIELLPRRKYFEDWTDLPLGLGIDEFSPFKRSSVRLWPMQLTVFGLPPAIRTLQEYQICCGLIPSASNFHETSSTIEPLTSSFP